MSSTLRPKPPSSLDYEALLHELQLQSFRSALLARDFGRADASAERLSQSPDRFWRWRGLVAVANLALARGLAEAALDALARAEKTRPEPEVLVHLARETRAHILIESGRPEDVEVLDLARGGRPLGLYWNALAAVRAGRTAETRGLPAPLARHVESETRPPEERVEDLEDATSQLGAAPIASATPVLVLRYALGDAQQADGREDEALATFVAIADASEAILHWPVPVAKSLYRAGRILERAGRTEDARERFASFLELWEGGELAPEWTARARQSIKS